MSAFYDQASLVVVPSGYKSGKIYAQKPLTTDGQLTFTRASAATRVNASGLIEEVASGLPRLDYLGSTCPKLLLEPQRTNLVTFSEQFDNAAWSKTNANVTANAVTSPDGYTNADFAVPTTTNGTHQIRQSIGISSGTYTLSFFAKQGGYKNLLVWFDGHSGGVGVNLDTLSVFRDQNNSGYKIEEYGNGWVRISVTCAISVLSVPSFYIYDNSATPQISFAGDTTSGIYVWGAQVEAGAHATSYIPTEGTTVTRLADDCYLNPTNLLGSTQGSWFADIQDFRFEVTGTTTPSVYVGYNASNYLAIVARASGNDVNIVFAKRESGTPNTIYTEVAPSGATKFCFTWNGTSLKLFVNGSKVYDDNSFAGFIAWDDFELNNDGRPVNYRLNQTLLFPTQISDADAIALTA